MKLTPKQLALKEQLSHARTAEKLQQATAEAEVRRLVEERLSTSAGAVDSLVAACVQAGVPKAQIGQALQTKDAATYNARIAKVQHLNVAAEMLAELPRITAQVSTTPPAHVLTFTDYEFDGNTYALVLTVPIEDGRPKPQRATVTHNGGAAVDPMTAIKLYTQPEASAALRNAQGANA